MVSLPSKLRICSASLLGNRDEQQDSFGFWEGDNRWLAVVADGAGGHLGGAKASRITVDLVHKLWDDFSGDLGFEPAEHLNQCLLEAHHKIIEETGNGDAHVSGKAAVVVVYCAEDRFWTAHVGDCRCYHLQGDKVMSKTSDDSLLQLLLDLGRISPEEAHGHPGQSRLMQALGVQEDPKVHISEANISAGSVILLCCDGFWNELTPENILSLTHAVGQENACAALQNLANRAVANAQGKSDNVTAVACFIA